MGYQTKFNAIRILYPENFLVQLSVIIINYNVRFFLEQCLHAVHYAIADLEAEVIVVDNHSTDGSIDYLRPLFPATRFIVNEENLGFAKANNLALTFCTGDYVLFLNPDTLVPDDCFKKCLAYIKSDPGIGALGVRMLDGRGRFLPESKRAFPSPLASLFKLTGLASLFPASGLFNKYALGNLDEFENHTVQVLAGAFMLVNRELLNRLKGFDESYFLYGEDIDLSYRIQQMGFRNVYFAGTTIIHFKGESSGKASLARVRFFYQAMLIFVQKHYRTGSAKIFSYFIRFAIACRAAIAAVNKMLKPILLPLIDMGLLWLALHIVKMLWVVYMRSGKDFGVPVISYALPLFALLFVIAAALIGLYDKVYKTSKTIVATAFAVISTLAVYSLLPEEFRFSRGVILWGSVSGSGFLLLLRQLLLLRKKEFFGQEAESNGQIVVTGTVAEYDEVATLMENAITTQTLVGRIAPDADERPALCKLRDLAFIQKQIRINELVFCVGQFSLPEIILQMQQLKGSGMRFLFHFSGSGSIVGSETMAAGSKTVAAFITYRITQPYQKRMKRLADVFLSFLFLLTAPLHLIIHPKGAQLLQNAIAVLTGKQTWVGYTLPSIQLPEIKKSVITHLGAKPVFDEHVLEKADRIYAKEYDWWMDMALVFKHYSGLG